MIRIISYIKKKVIGLLENYKYVLYFLAGLKLRKVTGKCKNLEEIFDKVSSFQYSFSKWKKYKVDLEIAQNKYEIIKIIKKIAKIRAKIILEIGTYKGGTLFLLSRFSSPNALILSIDLPAGPYGGGYPRFKIPFYKSFALNHQKIFLYRLDSHHSSSLLKIKKQLKNRQLDLLFIDGDHSYEGVKKDFESYSPLVRKDGIIAFHDIVEHLPEANCHVNKFWNEIKEKYNHIEIVEDWNQKWAGIGVLIK